MSRITIAPIVEGHGDDAAARILLQRIWMDLLGGEYVEVLRPIRRSRGRLLMPDGLDLSNAIGLAVLKLVQAGGRGLVLILVDAEDDCGRYGSLGPLLLDRARRARSDTDIACVVANVMYETWFAASAESLARYLDLAPAGTAPADPEGNRIGKGWVKAHMRARKYSETADQAALTAAMDLRLCRGRSPSFDKLCRELELRLRGAGDRGP